MKTRDAWKNMPDKPFSDGRSYLEDAKQRKNRMTSLADK
jgi:hypothetical protein